MTAVTAPSESYLALIREFPLRQIRSDEELDAAIAMLDKDGPEGWREGTG